MHRLLFISADTTCFPWEKRTPVEGFVSILAIAAALLLGDLTGHEAAGAIMASGAFAAGFAAHNPVMGSGIWSMVLTTLGVASATLIGSLCAHSTLLTLMVVALAAFNYAVLSHLTPSAGFIGQQCGVYAIIAGYFPGGVHFAAGRMSMILLGGALQIVLHLGMALYRDAPGVRSALHAPLFRRTNKLWITARTQTFALPGVVEYTVRLAITMVLCAALYRFGGMRNGYWIPMTALLVLKPDLASTLSRSIARLVGTLAGALAALSLSHWLPFHHTLLGVAALLAGFACYSFQAVNYALFSLGITLYIVFLFAFGGFSEHYAASLRLLNTAIGGGIALTLDAVWSVLSSRLSASADAVEKSSATKRTST